MKETAIEDLKGRDANGRHVAIVQLGIVGIVGAIVFVLFMVPNEQTIKGTAVAADIGTPIGQKLRDMIGEDETLLLDARFVVTSNRPPPYIRQTLQGISEAERLEWMLRWSAQKARPELRTFSPCGLGPVSVHGFLAQCTEVTGVRFLISKTVSAAAVEFGHSQALDGRQWSQAFTDTLRTNAPDWIDARLGKTRSENLFLLTKNGKNVLVLPEEMVPEFRAAGFEDFSWSFGE